MQPVPETFNDTPPLPTAEVLAQAAADFQPEPAASPTALAGIGEARRRDRIVILGRRGAGKTMYISMLFWLLWRAKDDLRMRAVDGQTHQACLETLQAIQDGRFPMSTTGTRYLNFELHYRGRIRSLVMLDYPGETFRKAFVGDDRSPEVVELLEHIDRAAGLILLSDPATATSKQLLERADDDFGFLKAVERVRSSTGGDSVPISLVLTKMDARQALVEPAGDAAAFVTRTFPQLVHEMRTYRVFACSACGEKLRNGVRVPYFSQSVKPFGLIEPLRHILEDLERQDDACEAEALELAQQKLERSATIRRRVNLTLIGILTAVVSAAVLGGLAWLWVKSV